MNFLRPLNVFAFVAFVVMLFVQSSIASPLCPSPRMNDIDLGSCKYGTTIGWCGNIECAKGPGERCGGKWLEYGSCGEGMYCGCGYCAGCYFVKCEPRRFC